jgi:hypothetical protein
MNGGLITLIKEFDKEKELFPTLTIYEYIKKYSNPNIKISTI